MNEKLSPDDLLNLLQSEAVLLPIPARKKGPMLTGWQNLSYENTLDEAYQKKLKTYRNTGVLLGIPSGGLISIDLDDDEAAKAFLDQNPTLLPSLRTRGMRGVNVWLRMSGPYPKSQRLKNHLGENVGEWRADGNQTVIQGVHPSGKPYSFENEAAPLHTEFSQISWGTITPPKCDIDTSDRSDTSEEYRGGNTSINLSTFAERIKAQKEAVMELEEQEGLNRLYKSYISRKINVVKGSRNSQLVASTTFLSRAVGDKILADLMSYFWRLNQDVFNDPLNQHMKEVRHHLTATKTDFEKNLKPAEREKYFVFDGCDDQQATFRICWGLSVLESDNLPRGCFFLSCANLGVRLGIHQQQAGRILKQLMGQRVIELHQKSTSRTKANSYRWTANQTPAFLTTTFSSRDNVQIWPSISRNN